MIDEETNEYYFIFTTHHSIADGRNCYELMVQFMNILGALLENKTCEDINENVQETKLSINELIANFLKDTNHKSKKIEHQPKLVHRLPNNVGNTVNGVHGKLECFL